MEEPPPLGRAERRSIVHSLYYMRSKYSILQIRETEFSNYRFTPGFRTWSLLAAVNLYEAKRDSG